MSSPTYDPTTIPSAPAKKRPVPNIAIIGGGLTGLLTATLLERAFAQQTDVSTPYTASILPNITIFEKSRSVGRLATRYRTEPHSQQQWQWAFGAQFFTAKSTTFKTFLAPWLQSGLLQPWHAQVVSLVTHTAQPPTLMAKEQWDSEHARYISTPKMTSWGRKLADELQQTRLQFKTRVAPLRSQDMIDDGDIANPHSDVTPQTTLFDEAGAYLGKFDWVICTAPNGQAAELMAESSFACADDILTVQMQACYTLMLGWDSQADMPKMLRHAADNDALPVWDVAYINDAVLDRAFIEHHKPERTSLLPSVTIHARNDWSQMHVDDDIETVKAQLLHAAKQALNWDEATEPTQIDCHRWRYAATVTDNQDHTAQKHDRSNQQSHHGILIDTKQQWIVSGDWCAQGNIESCYHAAADTVRTIMAGYAV